MLICTMYWSTFCSISRASDKTQKEEWNYEWESYSLVKRLMLTKVILCLDEVPCHHFYISGLSQVRSLVHYTGRLHPETWPGFYIVIFIS